MSRLDRRILSLWFPKFSLECWSRSLSAAELTQPFVLVTDSAHGPRTVAVNNAAYALGVRPSSRLADMRALVHGLMSYPHDPGAERAELERIALWCQRWGPLTAIDGHDGVLIDVTGSTHLFGGEQRLIHQVELLFSDKGVTVQTGIAHTPGAAWALSHYSNRSIITPDADPAMWLDPLPLSALRLEEDIILLLNRLGVRQIGHLNRIERGAVGRRFPNRRTVSGNPLRRMDQLLGRLPEPLLPMTDFKVPIVQTRLVEPLLHLNLLENVIDHLTRDLACALETQRRGVRRIVARFYRVDGIQFERKLELSSASRDHLHIAKLFKGKLDNIDAGFGIDLVQLLAPWTEHLELQQISLDGNTQIGSSLAQCLDKISNRLGKSAVLRIIPNSSHKPERSQKWINSLDSLQQFHHSFVFSDRPSKLLDRPEQIAVIYGAPEDPPRQFTWRGKRRMITKVQGPERIGPEWWRERSSARIRDYYFIETEAGSKFWIFRDGHLYDGRGNAPEWYLHGIC